MPLPTNGTTMMMEWEWNGNLMEVSRLRSGRLSKKNYPFSAAWTSECSWRATVAPAGWTSRGLRAPPHRWMAGGPDGTCRGHWLIPLLKKRLHVSIRACHPCACPCYFFSVSFKRETPRIMFVILTQGPLSPVLVQDVKIFIRRHCRRKE